jgi:hypothetical protein
LVIGKSEMTCIEKLQTCRMKMGFDLHVRNWPKADMHGKRL